MFRVWGEGLEKKTEVTILGFGVQDGNEGMEKKVETTIMGYQGITIGIHSFIPS